MNTIYRIIFNTATNTWVVASELAKGRTKKASRLVVAIALALGMGSAFAATTVADESIDETQVEQTETTATLPPLAQTFAAGDSVGIMGGNFNGTGTGLTIGPANGQGAHANGIGDVAVGNVSNANSGSANLQWATAVGDTSSASAADSSAFGNRANATATGATAIGAHANATGGNAVAAGNAAQAQGTGSIALGSSSSVGTGATDSVAIGRGATIGSNVTGAVALGASSSTSRNNTVAVGSTTSQRQIVNMAAGTQANDAVNVSQLTPMVNALGGGASIDPTTGAVTGPTYTMDDGNGNMVRVTNLGDAMTNIDGRVSGNTAQIASNTTQIANHATQITNLDGRVTDNATQIGNLADQLANSGLGLLSQDEATGAISLGATVGGTSLNVAGTDGNRVLSGLANGTGDTDAVTIAQLKAVGLVDPIGNPLAALVYDDMSLASATLGGTNGTAINNLAPGLIAAGSMQAVNGGQLFDMQQSFQSQFDNLSGQVGNLNDRVGGIEQGIADGTIGGGNGGGDVPGGAGSGEGSLQLGEGANASGDNGTAVGNGAVASGSGSTATGAGAVASGSGSTAVGAGAVASGKDSTALGSNSSATGNNSVALGAGSVADRDNTVSVGSEGHERQITNVAAGTQRTDAANWGQVQDAVDGVKDWASQKFTQMDKRIDRMGAMSAAYGQMAFSAQGLEQKNRLGVGVGMQNGQSAIAVGYSRQLSPKMNLSFGGSASGGGDVSVGAGLSMGW